VGDLASHHILRGTCLAGVATSFGGNTEKTLMPIEEVNHALQKAARTSRKTQPTAAET
jgi:hypothetical protein